MDESDYTARLFMQRAFDLAKLGMERVSPNPMVGCVIVFENRIIGEGYHQKYGEAHAEVNAIHAVKDKDLLKYATLYVTLEPCSHFGKTPPCADLIIKFGIKKVVIANLDPNPLVAGSGIKKLENAGIAIQVGLLAEIGLTLNRRFFKAFKENIPYIIIKWAETADRYIGKTNERLIISNSTTNMLVHKWRSEEDAIMVGSKTVIADNPSLNSRNWPLGKNPVRVIVDRHLKLSQDFKVFDGLQKTIILNEIKEDKNENLNWLKIENDFLLNSFSRLKKEGINSVLIEGGAELIQALFKANLYDEIRVIKSDMIAQNGIEAPKLPSGIPLIKQSKCLNDQIFIYRKTLIQ